MISFLHTGGPAGNSEVRRVRVLWSTTSPHCSRALLHARGLADLVHAPPKVGAAFETGRHSLVVEWTRLNAGRLNSDHQFVVPDEFVDPKAKSDSGPRPIQLKVDRRRSLGWVKEEAPAPCGPARKTHRAATALEGHLGDTVALLVGSPCPLEPCQIGNMRRIMVRIR
jgi:hypothetical protein